MEISMRKELSEMTLEELWELFVQNALYNIVKFCAKFPFEFFTDFE